MISYNIAPKHLNNNVFVRMISYFKDTRVKCKHTKDDDGYIIENVPNALSAEALKIVINAIYGKLGSELFWLYDRFAQMQVTINGQLMTMTLVEALELEGIHVISANTDGIVIKLPRDKIDIYERITKEWNEFNKMSADYEDYKILVVCNVNNYLDVQTNGKVEFKGALDPKQYIKDLSKGYDMPVVAIAVYEYFINNVPVMETLMNHKDVLDFCKTQNVSKTSRVYYQKVVNGKIVEVPIQRHFRFYVSNKGVILLKEINGVVQRLASGLPIIFLNSLDDKPIEERSIDYKYYYEEAYKIINPIKLGISVNQKGNMNRKTKSGKSLVKKYYKEYLNLFDEEE